MPLGNTSAGFKAAIQSNGYERRFKFTITLPQIGLLDLTANMVSCSYEESDVTSYPDGLTDKSGIDNTQAEVTLSGSTLISGALHSMIQLFNPDDSSSPLWLQEVRDSPATLSLGATVNGAPEYVDRVLYVTTVDVAVEDGTVAIGLVDEPPGWDQLPAIDAVLTAPPYNAGLTSEFVIDRIARIASGGAVSSWPAIRPNCIFAAGLRTSLWPEVGNILTGTWFNGTKSTPQFAPGVFGSAMTNANVTYSTSAPTGSPDLYVEFWASGTNTTTVFLSERTNQSGFYVSLLADFGAHTLTATIGNTDNNFSDQFVVTGLTSGKHYASAHFTVPKAGGTWSVVVTLDGTTTSSGSRSITGHGYPSSGVTAAAAIVTADVGALIEAVQATTETAPASNYGFTPLLVCDPSLQPLQAVPAIDAGGDAYTELQTIAEAEGGYIAFRSGVLTFLNRHTIASQSPSRTVTATTSMMALQNATTGSFQTFDSVQADFTEWSFQHDSSGNVKYTQVFTPTVPWYVGAQSTRTWTRTLTNGATAAEIDASLTYAHSNADPTLSQFRASLDKYGATEVPDSTKIQAWVKALSPSQIQITVTNNSTVPIWLVSPSNYTDYTVGTPSVWIAGVAVTPDTTTTLEVDTGSTASQYQAPTNQYRQDHDTAQSFANDLLTMLSYPQVLYGSVDVVPDPSITCADRITLDVPIDGGVKPIDVFVWGVSFSASFEPGQESWDMSLDVRAVAPPGAWILDRSVLGVSTLAY